MARGGRVAGIVAVDVYEAAIRLVTDMQMLAANATTLEPASSVIALCGEATRDVAATQISCMRWLLDS
jgi:hypothetical protein